MTTEPTAHPGNQVTQENHQTLHVHIHNEPRAAGLIGGMAGSVRTEEGNAAVVSCEVQLFFGPIAEHPVATCRTDANGCFRFRDLPPGFYGLRLRLKGAQFILLHNLRVLPGETCLPRVILSERTDSGPLFPGTEDDEAFVLRGIRMTEAQ